MGLVYNIPAGPHPDFATVETLGVVLANTPSARLYKTVVETKKAVLVASFLCVA